MQPALSFSSRSITPKIACIETKPVCVSVSLCVRIMVKYLLALTEGLEMMQNKGLGTKVIKDRKSRRKERHSERELKDR